MESPSRRIGTLPSRDNAHSKSSRTFISMLQSSDSANPGSGVLPSRILSPVASRGADSVDSIFNHYDKAKFDESTSSLSHIETDDAPMWKQNQQRSSRLLRPLSRPENAERPLSANASKPAVSTPTFSIASTTQFSVVDNFSPANASICNGYSPSVDSEYSQSGLHNDPLNQLPRNVAGNAWNSFISLHQSLPLCPVVESPDHIKKRRELRSPKLSARSLKHSQSQTQYPKRPISPAGNSSDSAGYSSESPEISDSLVTGSKGTGTGTLHSLAALARITPLALQMKHAVPDFSPRRFSDPCTGLSLRELAFGKQDDHVTPHSAADCAQSHRRPSRFTYSSFASTTINSRDRTRHQSRDEDSDDDSHAVPALSPTEQSISVDESRLPPTSIKTMTARRLSSSLRDPAKDDEANEVKRINSTIPDASLFSEGALPQPLSPLTPDIAHECDPAISVICNQAELAANVLKRRSSMTSDNGLTHDGAISQSPLSYCRRDSHQPRRSAPMNSPCVSPFSDGSDRGDAESDSGSASADWSPPLMPISSSYRRGAAYATSSPTGGATAASSGVAYHSAAATHSSRSVHPSYSDYQHQHYHHHHYDHHRVTHAAYAEEECHEEEYQCSGEADYCSCEHNGPIQCDGLFYVQYEELPDQLYSPPAAYQTQREDEQCCTCDRCAEHNEGHADEADYHQKEADGHEQPNNFRTWQEIRAEFDARAIATQQERRPMSGWVPPSTPYNNQNNNDFTFSPQTNSTADLTFGAYTSQSHWMEQQQTSPANRITVSFPPSYSYSPHQQPLSSPATGPIPAPLSHSESLSKVNQWSPLDHLPSSPPSFITKNGTRRFSRPSPIDIAVVKSANASPTVVAEPIELVDGVSIKFLIQAQKTLNHLEKQQAAAVPLVRIGDSPLSQHSLEPPAPRPVDTSTSKPHRDANSSGDRHHHAAINASFLDLPSPQIRKPLAASNFASRSDSLVTLQSYLKEDEKVGTAAGIRAVLQPTAGAAMITASDMALSTPMTQELRSPSPRHHKELSTESLSLSSHITPSQQQHHHQERQREGNAAETVLRSPEQTETKSIRNTDAISPRVLGDSALTSFDPLSSAEASPFSAPPIPLSSDLSAPHSSSVPHSRSGGFTVPVPPKIARAGSSYSTYTRALRPSNSNSNLTARPPSHPSPQPSPSPSPPLQPLPLPLPPASNNRDNNN